MFPALTAVIALLLAAASTSRPKQPADISGDSPWQQAAPSRFPNCNAQAEQELLEMANTERARLGLPPLKFDDGLVRAARGHAAEMAAQRQLSHQFSGEPGLDQRIAADTNLHLERAGENVAIARTSAQAHTALMSSPPHRDNILSPKFNVAGFGVVERGDMLYVAQDFGSSLTTYSAQQAEQLVTASIEQLRAQVHLPRLERINDGGAHRSACAMAKADSLNAPAPPGGAFVLRYTSMKLEKLPPGVSQVIARRGLHAYSAGTCYARTERYPNGAYWVMLVFY
jgi:uncharacterized protein YkwD